MKSFVVTVSNGERLDRFVINAQSRTEARRIAHIAHIGTGWDVLRVSLKK